MRMTLAAALLIAVAMPVWAQTAEPAVATEAAATEAAANNLPAITVFQVTKRSIEDHVLASGLIGPVEQVLVPPLIDGQPVETLLADVGDMVKAGQVLATLSTATLTLQKSQVIANDAVVKAAIAQAEAQIASAQSSSDDAKKTAERAAALFKQGSMSSAANDAAQTAATSANAGLAVALQGVKSAQAQLEVQAAQLANIDLQLSRTQIVAPVSGQISGRNAQIGGIATGSGQPLFTIIRDGALELSADVAEADLPRLTVDLPATLTLASGSARITGHIRLVAPTIDTNSRLGNARIALDASPTVRAGMFAEADILVATHDAVTVPVTAINQSGAAITVKLVKDGLVSEVAVTTGIRQGDWVEVLSGVAIGDILVAKAGAFVSDGDKINPIPSETN